MNLIGGDIHWRMSPLYWNLIVAGFGWLTLAGCEVERERIYIRSAQPVDAMAFDSAPTPINLSSALQAFAATHESRCRQHVKRWDEWSCAGPHGLRVTFEPDRGMQRYIAEFTLVIRSEQAERDYRDYVDSFVEFMEAKFNEPVARSGHH